MGLLLPATLCSAAAAAIINIWLMIRIGRVRAKEHVMHGDGGIPLLTQRMRAQLNFVESTPFILILVGAVELAGRGGIWLAVVAGIYFLARIAHAFGMDRPDANALRASGTMATMLMMLGLSVTALLIVLRIF